MRARAEMLGTIREFFAAAGVMEVETPLAGRCFGTDPAIHPMETSFTGPGYASGLPLYLQSSPEFAMKRLLAAGSGAVYQICKAFRNGELGKLHNPEFTILEWYRPDFDLRQLMDEVAALVRRVLGKPVAVEYISYRALFGRYFDLDPCEVPVDQLASLAVKSIEGGLPAIAADDRDGWLDLLMTHALEPGLGREGLSFVYDYPASQASLARLNPDDPAVAQRFELYYQGVELANGFYELADAGLQRCRFDAENRQRVENGDPVLALDERLLAALDRGLPDCSGVALGLDRLLLLRVGAASLSEIISFPVDQA